VLICSLPALGADLSEKLAPCLSCHGAEGQSQIENVPSLGAQTTSYSVIQLFMFRENIRVADPMNEVAKELRRRVAIDGSRVCRPADAEAAG